MNHISSSSSTKRRLTGKLFAKCNQSARYALPLLLMFSLLNHAWSQNEGIIVGRVLDASINSPLPGANIVIEGSNIGTITDVYGNFSISNVNPGQITLLVSFVGYEKELIDLEVSAGSRNELIVKLKPETTGLEEVVITAQLLGQRKAISQQLSADAIVNIVSEEKLKELPDVNAAEAIGRLPGIAIQRSAGEGQKVIIRGMEPRFSSITINGVRVPSNDANDKSVDLSMISSETLAGIEVYKSPTPDMDAEAIGGTVNLMLKKAPEKPGFDLKAEGAYNVMKNDWRNYKSSFNLNKRVMDNKLGAILQGSIERINRSSQTFGGNYQILEQIRPVSFLLEDRVEVRDRASLNINTDYRLPKGAITLYSYYALTNRNAEGRTQAFDPFTNNNVRFTHNSSEVQMNLWSTLISGEHNFNRWKLDWSGSYARTKNETPYSSNIAFPDEGAYAHNPDIREDASFPRWADSARTDYTRAHLYRGGISHSGVIENNYSGAVNAEVPISLGNSISGTFKAGGKHRLLTRQFNNFSLAEDFYFLRSSEMNNAIAQWEQENPSLEMTPDGKVSMNNFIDPDPYVIGEILNGDYHMTNPLSSEIIRNWFNNQQDILNEDRTSWVNDYALSESVTAGYMMMKLNIGSFITAIPGIRFEQSVNDYTGKYSRLQERYGSDGFIVDTSTSTAYGEWLPHLHLRIKPANWFDIRLSAAKTLARPNYNMVIPKIDIDLTRARIYAGNPNLKHMEAMNYDVTLSFYQGKYGLIAFSGFYKDLTNIFFPVQGFYLASDSIAAAWGFPTRESFTLNSYDNSPEAKVYGYEIDLQTNLNFLPHPLKGIVISANITRQYSETYKYSYITQDSILGRDPVTGQILMDRWSELKSRKISMPGQTPFIFNLSLGYDFKGFSGRISGNYQDKYLIVPGQVEINDVWNGSFWRWDLALKQKITRNLIMHLNVANLNNMKEQTFRNDDLRFPGRIHHYGTTITYGLQLKL